MQGWNRRSIHEDEATGLDAQGRLRKSDYKDRLRYMNNLKDEGYIDTQVAYTIETMTPLDHCSRTVMFVG